MNMRGIITSSKLLIGSTALLVAILLVAGFFFPESYLMRFADSSLVFGFIRLAVLIVLIGMLFTNPPRALVFRLIMAGMAIIGTSVSIEAFLNYNLGVLDMLVFLEVGILFAIDSLEMKKEKTTTPQYAARKIDVIQA